MAWIEARKRRDGSMSYWVRDIRDGRQICILADSRRDAECKLEGYKVRKDIEKEGYEDQYADDAFGKREASNS